MPEPLISVVIPAYNRRDSVLQLLADLYRQQGVGFEVIVVDDCSPDDTVAAIKEHYPETIVLRNEQNSGPAVSRNRGVQTARGQFIVGFDSDVTVPDPTLLQRVADRFEQMPMATGLAFRLLEPDGKADDKPRWWHPVPIADYANAFFETHYFSGTGYAFRREAMIAAGIYPEWLYMHYEEVVLALRILDAGGTIVHCPDLPVRHHASPVAARSKIKMFYKPRNQILVALACYSWPKAVGYLAPRLGYNALVALRNGHIGEFSKALGSAREMGRKITSDRMPLKNETWRRIRKLKRQSVIMEPSLVIP